VLLFNDLFHSVDLRHLLISKIPPVMGRHWGIRYCIHSCKYISFRLINSTCDCEAW